MMYKPYKLRAIVSAAPLLLIALLTTLLAACSGQAPVRESDVDLASPSGAATYATGDDLGGSIGNAGANGRVVYFAYDSSSVTNEGRAVIQTHVRQLKANPTTQVLLEGHADERGTREYNLALGESRANAVALLMGLDLGPGRIQTISYGEERPVARGSSESDWRLNRRVEIRYR